MGAFNLRPPSAQTCWHSLELKPRTHMSETMTCVELHLPGFELCAGCAECQDIPARVSPPARWIRLLFYPVLPFFFSPTRRSVEFLCGIWGQRSLSEKQGAWDEVDKHKARLRDLLCFASLGPSVEPLVHHLRTKILLLLSPQTTPKFSFRKQLWLCRWCSHR